MSATKDFVKEVKDFVVPPGQTIPRIHQPSTIQFLRDFVAKNQPCILTGIIDDWPAMVEWQDDEYLCNKLGESKININVTPTGFGDAVANGVFVKPEERPMTIREFLECIKSRNCDETDVYYLSHQNDNLSTDAPELLSDATGCLQLALEAFGNKPDAVNLWIGDERAVSTMHADSYENMYAVVRGTKVFHLLPPMCGELLDFKEFPQSRYHYNKDADQWELIPESESGTVPWTSYVFDKELPDGFNKEHHDDLQELVCKTQVCAGEVLYLPSMWYHQVTQSELTFAVNYWHDMHFGDRWVMLNTMERYAESHNQSKRKNQ